MNSASLCKTCGRVREYPYCLDKFHDEPAPNPMLDALNPILDKLDGMGF